MTLIKCIITLVLVALGVCAIAQASGARRKLYIVDGYFFHRIPVDKADIVSKYELEAPGGTKVTAVIITEPLSDLMIQRALPPAIIPEYDYLMRRYRGLQEQR